MGALTLQQSYCSCRDTVNIANKKKVTMANTAVDIIEILSQETESSIKVFTIHQTMKGIMTPGVAHHPRTQNFLILPAHKNSMSSTTVFQPDDGMNIVSDRYKTTSRSDAVSDLYIQGRLLFDNKRQWSESICKYIYAHRVEDK